MHEILVEESVIGWKEFELEVMRDVADNFVVICSIENIDPMGVHTGDSITVAPALTLTDKEYQRMRDMGRRIIRRVGVETGGSNIQFAINPADGRIVAIEMNPRVSRSSALASKATGFPIAKIAAKLALGYHLDEIPNDITRLTPASFEPTIDYIVVKFPRWNFEKFPQADPHADDADEVGGRGDGDRPHVQGSVPEGGALARARKERQPLSRLTPMRARRTRRRFAEASWCRPIGACGRSSARSHRGWTIETLHELTKIDPWFLQQFADIVELRKMAALGEFREMSTDLLRTLKRSGFSDADIAGVFGIDEELVRQRRIEEGLVPAYKRIDTCAAEFESFTPYMYGTYEQVDEAEPTPKKKVVILGSGPNRIGQGIEFDYCCVHAVFGFREEGFETVMVNCNPETVSTDYDTADRLYFEPLTFEDVMAIIERERERRRRGVVRRAVRRADAAEAGAAAAGGGRHDPRHVARLDRPRRGPPALLAAAVGPRRAAAGERHRGLARGSARGGRADRVSRRRAAVVRPRRPRHGDRVRLRRARSLHDRRRRRVARSAGAHRSLPRGRLRVRRRCGGRRRGRRGHRRHHGAHRGGGHPLGRQFVRGAAVHGGRAPPRRRSASTRGASPAR